QPLGAGASLGFPPSLCFDLFKSWPKRLECVRDEWMGWSKALEGRDGLTMVSSIELLMRCPDQVLGRTIPHLSRPKVLERRLCLFCEVSCLSTVGLETQGLSREVQRCLIGILSVGRSSVGQRRLIVLFACEALPILESPVKLTLDAANLSGAWREQRGFFE